MSITIFTGIVIISCLAIISSMIENIIKLICDTIAETSRNKLALKRYDEKFIDADYE